MCYGSGVVINHRKGYVLTADHVVERGKCIEVITTSGKTYTVQNIKTLGSDIALLDVGMKMDAKSARLSPSEPYLGEDIYLIGIPSSHTFVGSISKGIISGKNRENNVFIPGVKLYQTDALLTGGNSGGGWYDRGGNLIAISNLKIGYTGNVGLGVPSTHILKLLQEQK
jgi:serine protease Do